MESVHRHAESLGRHSIEPGCDRERTYTAVGEALRRMCCGRGCGRRVAVAWLATGPVLNQRIRPRRMALLGPEGRQ